MDNPDIVTPVTPKNCKTKGVAPEIRRLHMRYPEMTQSQIAHRVGCHRTNVSRVLQRFLGDNIAQDEHDAFLEHRASIMDRVQHRILASIDDATISKALLLPRVTAAAILEDKARVARGQAVGINVSVLMDVVDAIRAQGPVQAHDASVTVPGVPRGDAS